MEGSAIIPILEDENGKRSVLLVHRRLSKFGFSFPAGIRDPGDNDHEDCALREFKEEVGIGLKRSDLHSYGEYTFDYTAYDEKWNHTTHMFMAEISVSKKDAETIIANFVPNDEIDEIQIVELEKMGTKDQPNITQHHLHAIKMIMGITSEKQPQFNHLIRYKIF
jgi:8-oxo-dGTP pyrophosphatase MutT (NUDIX family)